MLSLAQEIGRLEAKLLVVGRGLLISGKTTDSSGRRPLFLKLRNLGVSAERLPGNTYSYRFSSRAARRSCTDSRTHPEYSLPPDVTQEAKYVESWPNTTSAWAGWSRFDVPVDSYGGVQTFPVTLHQSYTGVFYLLIGYPAGKYFLSKISKSGQGQHSVYSVDVTL
jgi:hypothetical protein